MSVTLTITSNVLEYPSERRFPLITTIAELKKKLELIVGASASNMQLELRQKDDKFFASLTDADASLQSLDVADGMILHVVDTDSNNPLFAVGGDDSMVEKFELSDQAYETRSDSVRAWKQREGLGRFNANEAELKQQREQRLIDESRIAANGIQIGHRCIAKLQNQPEKRGTVAYIGEVHFKPGVWIGVRYDEPVGRNDGSIDGKRYFECADKYGGFVRSQDIQIGDFPALSVEGDQDMDEI